MAKEEEADYDEFSDSDDEIAFENRKPRQDKMNMFDKENSPENMDQNIMVGQKIDTIDLEYGDIIQIVSPSNLEYHQVMFFINYIDERKVKLLNINTSDLYELAVREDTTGFTDESIIAVYLLDRSKVAGYARQKGLITGVWVDIHFEKLPTITAEITNLEEDQIELTTYPQLKILYIDFAYRGIPEDIPILRFVIREKPATLKNASSLSLLREQVAENEAANEEPFFQSQQETEEATQDYLANGESIIRIPEGVQPDVDIKTALREEFRKTQPKKTGIIFGEFLDVVEQFVEVAENKKRYNIDVQLNSYMDELLSTVPYSARTNKFMTRIHILVERYKELREMYSEFDDAGNIKWLKKTNPTTHKPLLQHIEKMDIKLPWIVPIVSTIKNIYQDRELPFLDQDDVEKYDQDSIIYDEQNLMNDLYYNASSEQNKYVNFYRQLNTNYMTPMKTPLNDDVFLKKIPVGTTTEAFVQNTYNIYSSSISDDELKNHRFSTQTYTTPLYYMTKEMRYNDNNHYVQKPLTRVDELTFQSLLTMPMPVIQYSRAFLPGTFLLDRVQLSSLNYLPSFFLNKRTNVEKVQINDFSKELAFEIKDNEKDDGKKEFQYLTTITQYILNHNLLEDQDKFHKFLEVVLPNIWTCIRFLSSQSANTSNKYSFQTIVSMLEPFLIYDNDISYTQYKEIRYMIKQQVAELKKVLQEKIKEFGEYKNNKYNVFLLPPLIPNIFSEKRELADLMDIGYKFGAIKKSEESLHKILTTDDAELFALLMQTMMLYLVTPESILDTESSAIDWTDSDGNSAQCGTEVLAKKYTKIDDLIKDNGKFDIFFDKEFDETNYSVLKKYEKEKKQMVDDAKFVEFLAENLVQKHGIVREKSVELAEILIAGKKIVKDGQYAVLELSPQLPKDLAASDSDSVEAESRTKYTYYVRRNNEWIADKSLDEMAFLDSGSLFCNLKSLKCNKINDSLDNTCEYGASYFYNLERNKAEKEFERRYDVSIESLEETLNTKINKHTHMVSRLQTLRDIQREKSSLLAFYMGSRAQHVDSIISPRAPLLRIIYGQKDFIEKQVNIVKFFEKFCREPMIAERDEDPYWKYCVSTNTKLLPSFMYHLANIFVHFGQDAYARELNTIINLQGEEQDGFIYDKYTHEVIKKIDNVQEDQYTDEGFRIITSSVIEKDVGSIVRDKLVSSGKQSQRVFENLLSEEIYKIYAAISSKIASFSEEVWENVNQLSAKFIENEKIIPNQMLYEKKSKQDEEKKGIKPISYEKMRNKKVIQIVASVLFIVIQTSTPSFKGNKTFPGCVLSFDGFPLSGEENLRGIEYMACILKGISSADIKPWSAIHKTGPNMMRDQMQVLIKTYLLQNPAIIALYDSKREYLSLSLDEEDLPYEHRIEKWQQFMPPLIDIEVKPQPIGSGFVKEYWSLMRSGNKDQWNNEFAIQSKMANYGNAIIETIQKIVNTKTLLLKTSGNIPYLQNSCCNEKTTSKMAIMYFVEQEGSPLQQYVGTVYELSKMMHKVHLFRSAAFLRNLFSRYHHPIMATEIMEENLYSAIIYYCGLDSGKIPYEFRGFFDEIPENYKSSMTLDEKIKFIKMKKRFDLNDLDHLMRIVRERNMVYLLNQPVQTAIERFGDVLTVFNEETDIDIYSKDIRDSIYELLEFYNPDKMFAIDMVQLPQIKVLAKLKRDLFQANEELYTKIMKFINKSRKINVRTSAEISQFLLDMYKWDIDTSDETNYYDANFYRVQQYFKNALYDLTHYFPGLLLNRGTDNTALNYYEGGKKNDRIHRYWNLSDYDKNDLKKTVQKYQQELYKFQEDEVIVELIRSIHPRLIDLNMWINEMPVFSSLMKDREYFHLFDKSCVHMLDQYLIYSAMYMYIKASSERVILQKERQNSLQKRRADISERDDPFQAGISQQEMDEEMLEDYDELEEVEMMVDEGQQSSLDERVADFLMIFINMYKENKKNTDYTYDEIERNMNTERTKEKERIMKRFTLDDKGNDKKEDERKIEYAKKKLGLGIWNVGKQKTMFQYDKATSNRERMEMLQQQVDQELIEDVEPDNEIDTESVEAEDAGEVDEGFNIQNYRAENDGVYYSSDEENDFDED
jgi:hypothetical protein